MKTKLEKTLHHATDTITQLLLCLDRPDLIGEDFEEYKQNAMSEAGKVQKDIWFNYLRKTTSDNRKNQNNQKTVCLYNRNDGYTYIFSSKLGWVAYPTWDNGQPDFLNPTHVDDLEIPDQKKNALLAWLEDEQRHHGLVREPDQGEIPDYDWWKNDPVEIFRKRLGEYETELVTVYGIDDPKSWVVHHQDATGTLNYQREFESEDVAISHAKSLKMHFSDKPLAEGVTPKFRMI